MAAIRREVLGLIDSYKRVNPANEKAFDRLQAKALKIANREVAKNKRNREEYEEYAKDAAPDQKKNALRLVKAFASKEEQYGYAAEKLRKPVSYEELGKCLFKMRKVDGAGSAKYENTEDRQGEGMDVERLNKTLADIETALLRKGVEQIRNIVDQASEDEFEDYESEFDEDYESELDEASGDHGDLMDYKSGERIRAASKAEQRASKAAARSDGGAGVIKVDGRSCYVED